MKRTITLLIMCCMLICFAACTKPTVNPNDDTTTPGDSQSVSPGSSGTQNDTTTPADTTTAVTNRADVQDNLPEANYNNAIYRILIQNYSPAVDDFIVESHGGDAIQSAIHTAQLAVEDRFGVRFDFSTDTNQDLNNKIKNIVTSGATEDSFDLIAQRASWSALLITQDCFLPFSQVDNIDISREWWNNVAYDELSIGGETYFIVGDIVQSYIESMYGIYFNRAMAKEYGLDGIYATVSRGEWTYEKFLTVLSNVYIDDGNGVRDESDTYGCALQCTGYPMAFQASFDAISVKHNADGMPILDPDQEKWIDMSTKIYDLMYNTPGCYSFFDWKQGYYTMFKNGQALMMPGQLVTALMGVFTDMDDTYGIIPLPKYNEAQPDYYTLSDNAASAVEVMKTARDPAMSGMIAEALCAESWRYVTPETFDKALKYKYAEDAEQAEMMEIIRAGIRYDFGLIYNCGPRLTELCATQQSSNFASYYKTSSKLWSNKLDQFVEAFKKIS